MLRPLKLASLLLLVLTAAPAMADSKLVDENTGSSRGGLKIVAPPPGFEQLERSAEMLTDVYFGGRKVGEAVAITAPGIVRFKSPADLVKLLPSVKERPFLTTVLAADLPSNAHLVCAQTNTHQCGALSPDTIGAIFDEQSSRIDLFIHPKFLELRSSPKQIYLPSPASELSLTSSFGLAMSGTGHSSPVHNVQNRTTLGFGRARIRSDSSFASDLGMVFDNLVAEVDTNTRRFSAGMFWAPGLDLTGRRRIIGLGVERQFDTRADREELSGTPLILFLSQPARVEILVDGRLVDSGSYEAGNNLLNTASLPSGSYPVTLRVRTASGDVREESRFFVKTAQVAPVGEPIYSAHIGLLANTKANQPISLSNTLFYQLSAGRRLNQRFAIDAAVTGTQRKAVLEVGAWTLTPHVRARGAALFSSSGDRGALLQLGSSGRGPLNFNFDLRRVWSKDGKALIPLPSYVANFGTEPVTRAQIGDGSFTQITGNVSYRIGAGHIGVIGSYRRDEGSPADYTIGPNAIWPVLNTRGMQLTFHADAQKTRGTTAAYTGFRMLFTSARFALQGTAGRSSIRGENDSLSKAAKAVGSISGQWSHQRQDGSDVSVGASVDRGLETTTAHANAAIRSQFGTGRADLLHSLYGGGSGLQYGLTFQSGIAATGGALQMGGRDLSESALIAAVDGIESNSQFDVLVDELPRGRVRSGEPLLLFLQPYRSYSIRLKLVGATAVMFDSAAHRVNLFPGSVKHLSWKAERYLTVFGQAVGANGMPVNGAMVRSRRGIGQTDDNGYFQVDVTASDMLKFFGKNGQLCAVPVAQIATDRDYASIGKVTCS